MKKIAVLAAALAACAVCAPAMAYESGAYVRGEIGNTDFSAEAGGVSSESDDNSFGFRAGYYFNPYFGVEGFLARYGDDDGNGASTKVDGYGAGLVGKYNFGANYDGFYVDGRVGMARIDTEVEIDGLGSSDAGDTTPYFGVGVGYDFAWNMGVGLNYQVARPEYDGVDVDVESLMLDFEFRF